PRTTRHSQITATPLPHACGLWTADCGQGRNSGSVRALRHVARRAIHRPTAHDVPHRQDSHYLPTVHHHEVAEAAAHHRFGRAFEGPIAGRDGEVGGEVVGDLL